MSIKIITPPTAEPVDVGATKAHNRITISDDDALIASYITAARTFAEQKLGRCIITTRLELDLDSFPAYLDVLNLPRGPVQALALFTYLDSKSLQWTAVEADLQNPTTIVLDTTANVAQIGLANGKMWPTALDQMNSVRIQYDSGWGADASAVPAAIKVYIMALVGAMYNNRETHAEKAAVSIDFLERLLDPFLEPSL